MSPLVANIYLHHVLDVWFTTEGQPRLRGRSVLVRYADDVVIVVEQESDAHRVLEVLPKRSTAGFDSGVSQQEWRVELTE